MPKCAWTSRTIFVDLDFVPSLLFCNDTTTTFTEGFEMKKFFMILTVVAVAGVAQAQTKAMAKSGGGDHAIDGCGLGWQVTDSRTMIGTTTRGTTNAFVPPSFGMTSGTIGCDQIPFAANEKEAATFVASNYQTLKSELAVGQGEYVSAMIESFGCASTQVPAISQKIQQNYNTVVAPTQNATELFNNLKREVNHCG
jgi:hypothetical protein